jgi:hypothetical protein
MFHINDQAVKPTEPAPKNALVVTLKTLKQQIMTSVTSVVTLLSGQIWQAELEVETIRVDHNAVYVTVSVTPQIYPENVDKEILRNVTFLVQP